MSARDPVALLLAMVETESLSGREGALARLLVRAMAELGLDAFVDGAGNAVGVKQGAEPPGGVWREVVLVGHMDTVPGRVPVRLEDGKLHGRGAVDAKGPLAAFVHAAARAEPAPGVRLVVAGAVEEEAASSRGGRFLAGRPRPVACLVGEPSGWDALTVGYKGRMLAEARVEQPCGHSAGPRGGVAERVFELWSGVLRHCPALDTARGAARAFERVSPTLLSVRTSSDGLADVAEATISLRLPPREDTVALATALRALAERAGVALRVHGVEPAWTSPRTSPLARAFARVLARRGAAPRYLHKTGTSDMNVLGPVWRCPIAAYGPGDSSLDHAPDEHVEIAEYLRSIEVLGELLVEAGWAAARRGSVAASR